MIEEKELFFKNNFILLLLEKSEKSYKNFKISAIFKKNCNIKEIILYFGKEPKNFLIEIDKNYSIFNRTLFIYSNDVCLINDKINFIKHIPIIVSLKSILINMLNHTNITEYVIELANIQNDNLRKKNRIVCQFFEIISQLDINCFISDIKPIINKIKDILNFNNCPFEEEFRKLFYENINNYYFLDKDISLVINIAVFLDPRYKTNYLNNEETDKCINKIKVIIDLMKRSHIVKYKDDLEYTGALIIDEEEHILREYANLRINENIIDPISWWTKNYEKFKEIFPVAMLFFSSKLYEKNINFHQSTYDSDWIVDDKLSLPAKLYLLN